MKSDDITISAPGPEPGPRESPSSGDWTMIIGPSSPWYRLDLQELRRYRDLVRLFVRRDLVAHSKQTILGPLWFFLQPLLSAIVFTVVFGRIAGIPTDGAPDFLYFSLPFRLYVKHQETVGNVGKGDKLVATWAPR